MHNGFCFSAMVCSDFLDISRRAALRGKIDALMVLSWNKDVNTFTSLVEAASMDLHCYVVYVNNREYGDSRVRAPRAAEYERDLVRVRGGRDDYYMVTKIDAAALRAFQQGDVTIEPKPLKDGHNSGFKPLPIGFEFADFRK